MKHKQIIFALFAILAFSLSMQAQIFKSCKVDQGREMDR